MGLSIQKYDMFAAPMMDGVFMSCRLEKFEVGACIIRNIYSMLLFN